MKNLSSQSWLIYCRPNFEIDAAQELLQQARQQRPITVESLAKPKSDTGFAVVALNSEHKPDFSQLIFARQLLRVLSVVSDLPERDRLTPIVDAILALKVSFSDVWLEVADTNDGKALSSFTKRFLPLLHEALAEHNLFSYDQTQPRLHLFFPDKTSVYLCQNEPYNSSNFMMGIHRQTMPSEAPSRSTLKLAEAFEVFLSKSEQQRLLRTGMTAVDLGAAPGGWTYQLVKRGLRVTAIDNGPMKGAMHKHPQVQHLRVDGFKYAPPKTVDWLVCDMVEKPAKVAELMLHWMVAGYTRNMIFNLKLPMKQRVPEVYRALDNIRQQLESEDIHFRLQAKHLYHDREEVTVLLCRNKNR